MQADGQRFDVVVLDPPAFIKRRKDQAQGEKAYHQINELGLNLLAPGGVLASASCSLHLPPTTCSTSFAVPVAIAVAACRSSPAWARDRITRSIPRSRKPRT